MRLPETHLELLDEPTAAAVRSHLPWIYQWLDGNGLLEDCGPGHHAIELPVILEDRGMWDSTYGHVLVTTRRYWAPAPWAGRVYVYVWPVAVIGDVVLAHGEPYRVYDDHATLLASIGRDL